MYFTKCGKAIPDVACSCLYCENIPNHKLKKENILSNIISFIISIFEMLIWLIYKNARPKAASLVLFFAFLLMTIRWINLF